MIKVYEHGFSRAYLKLQKLGTVYISDFENVLDAILVLETVGQKAGLSCWTREDLQRYPLLRLD
ncbi:hypothetical protein [Myxosarcina sp. GI1(2024)]